MRTLAKRTFVGILKKSKREVTHMRFGAHVSIAGSVAEAPSRALAVGCRTMQIFTKNARQWKAKPLSEEEVEGFRSAVAESPIWALVAHNTYLINMADPEDSGWNKSVEAMKDEVERCEALGVPYLVTHPGSHRGSGEEAGLRRVAEALDAVHSALPDAVCRIALEATAGQGNALGWRFEHLSEILALVREPQRLAFCLDTCHVFAAGYDLVEAKGYEETMRTFEKAVGLDKLACWHLNDSLKGLGSRVDRHAHIGKGAIGEKGFRRLVNDDRFFSTPMILETPKDKPTSDIENLSRLRSIVTGKAKKASKTLDPKEVLPKTAKKGKRKS
jgi:deoxyribonuclease-4